MDTDRRALVLPRRGRRARLLALLVVAALLLLGSTKGSDDDFPFGPFRMFATSGRTSGAVRAAILVGEDQDGRRHEIGPSAVALRRAELEGQYGRFTADPELLHVLADRYERHHHRLAALRLEQRIRRVIDGHVQPGREQVLVAEWRR